jgi:hypothetical protein
VEIVTVYGPFLSASLLRVQTLRLPELVLVVGAGIAMLLGTEIEEWWNRRLLCPRVR